MSESAELRDRVKVRKSCKKKPLSHGWIVVPSKSHPDRVYFYNTVTKCSTWINPCEGNDSSSSESSSESSPSSLFLSQTSTGQSSSSSSSHPSHKSLVTDNAPNLPVQSRELKDNKNKNSIDKESKNSDIEDFDEFDEYFESDTGNIVSSSNSGEVHSPDICFIEDNVIIDGMKSNSSTEDNKELWWCGSSRGKNNCVKKSVALSDIEEKLSCDINMSKDSHKTGKNWCDDDVPSVGGSSSKRSKSSRRRSKKSSNETQTKSHVPNLTKQQNFKRRDKTPAQTRLLKLREKNAELLKGCGLSEERDKTSASSQDSRPRNTNQNLERKGPSQSSASNFDSDAIIIDDYMEEMDWEPTSEELDAQNINELCEQMDMTRESSSDLFSSISHSVTEVANPSYSWILVLDTNVLVSCLGFIKELRDTGFPGLGYPIIYIPWRVLQELDHLKDSRIEGTFSHLSTNVRKAVSYLNENFKSLHPRCIGQSFDDFKEMVDADTVAPDDEILQTCLRLQKLQPEKRLTLLTNDKNLESKALVSRIETYSKDEFQKKYFKSGTHPRIPTESKKTSKLGAAEIDNFVCELKRILKNFVPFMVETEMKLAFNKDWIKLAFKKPPWTLQDSFDCLLKHWRSVFFAIFSKDVFIETESLYPRLFRKEPETAEEICDIIYTSQKFLFKIKNCLISLRPYSAELESTTTRLSKLQQEVLSRSAQVNNQVHSLTPDERVNGFSLGETSRSESSTNWDADRMKNMLKDIWNSLNNFCFTLSNLTSSPTDRPNGLLMLETRMKLSQTLNGLRELIFSITKILEIPVRQINECHPVIIHLANFLIKLLPSMNSQLMETELAKYLVVVCTEPEGRSLLSGSLKDFNDFAENLSKANEFFENRSPPF